MTSIPKHGTNARYNFHACRCDLCKLAHYRAMKRYRHGLAQTTIPAIGTQRRIRALTAMGWTGRQIAEKSGWSLGTIRCFNRSEHTQVYTGTHIRMVEVFEEWCMTPGPSNAARAAARRLGYALPLEWDYTPGPHFIDDPDATPYRSTALSGKHDGHVDEVLVQRALAGVRVNSNQQEKAEITRRWTANGGSLAELIRIQHWSWDTVRHARGAA